MTFFVIQRDSLERTDRVSVLSTAGALGAPLPILKEKLMSNVAGAQAQANRHAGRNTSDIDELRDNIADIASSVGDMASYQYEQAYDVATDAVEETGQMSDATRSPQSESV